MTIVRTPRLRTSTNTPTRPTTRTTTRTAVALAAASLLLTACTGAGASDVPAGTQAASAASTVNVYAFSVAKPAIDALSKAYTATPAGAGSGVQVSYGPSGDQSRKVLAGAPADLVAFSLAPDVTRLVDAGLVSPTWDADDAGTPFGSVVVFVVRPGNPKGLYTWEDLLGEGVQVVTPNPLSSGSAQWNLLAPYAWASAGGQNPHAGLDYLDAMITHHVTTQPGSAAEATESFRQGTGDVLLSYENEAIAAIAAGDDFELVLPPQTFKIENAVAVIENGANAVAARHFVDFIASPVGQEAVARAGYRPADQAVLAAHREFPVPEKLWTIDDLGGWPAVTSALFNKDDGAITALYLKAAS